MQPAGTPRRDARPEVEGASGLRWIQVQRYLHRLVASAADVVIGPMGPFNTMSLILKGTAFVDLLWSFRVHDFGLIVRQLSICSGMPSTVRTDAVLEFCSPQSSCDMVQFQSTPVASLGHMH